MFLSAAFFLSPLHLVLQKPKVFVKFVRNHLSSVSFRILFHIIKDDEVFMKSIALTGGGTAGHVMPNLALLPELYKYFDKIIYLGGNGMEKEIVPRYGIRFFETPVVRLNRENITENFKIPYVLLRGIREAKTILEGARTDVVFSKGGYAALPACFAAKSLKIPVITHESDYTMGVANKLISMFAAATLTSFPETPGGIFTGNPVRPEIFRGSASRAREKYNLRSPHVILIFGGSLGAEAINQAVERCLDNLLSIGDVVHIAGKGAIASERKGYVRLPFSDDMPDLYAAADVVVIRGGANSLAEVAALGKRALCIPLPKGASRGDQLENARSYQKSGLVRVMEQDSLTPESLYAAIDALLSADPPKGVYHRANEAIVKEILKVL
jgi:UDP-N-acetylglucosamine--N-acetylmuramyl-(pentapeptide) pyrophosphoryl-undecaprenol N-acetylglucosamine transferase